MMHVKIERCVFAFYRVVLEISVGEDLVMVMCIWERVRK
jgi:hypothetical protein